MTDERQVATKFEKTKRTEGVIAGSWKRMKKPHLINYIKLLPLRRMLRWREICYGDVAVCVSVTLMYCAQRLRRSSCTFTKL